MERSGKTKGQKMPPIRVLEIAGSPYEMGYQHGLAYAKEIRALADERIRLCGDPLWTGQAMPRERILALGEMCLSAHWEYAPDQMEQLEGIAAASGVSLTELVITNGFTDFVDFVNASEAALTGVRQAAECTAFLVGETAAADGLGLIGQTWDMHASATPFVILLRAHPNDGPAFLAFSLTGCVGMMGMNEAGIAICINNLLAANGQPGVTWPFVARKVLTQTTIEGALECITSARVAGGHNYMVADGNGHGFNIEAMPAAIHIEPLQDTSLVHANQCLSDATRTDECSLTESWKQDSSARAERASRHVSEYPVSVERLMALTRDRSDGVNSVCSIADTPGSSETCCAAIMRPATGDFWGVWGLPTENEYEHFSVS
jgi:isopenicillin-N N-acyltransferase-like protein